MIGKFFYKVDTVSGEVMIIPHPQHEPSVLLFRHCCHNQASCTIAAFHNYVLPIMEEHSLTEYELTEKYND